jgi:CDP-diacylglycerol--glycerol-3-phosphate 3-phosphatidyltransferase
MLPILFGFLVDWLVVSGRISSTTATTHFFNRLAHFSHSFFQPLLRATLLIALLLFALQDGFPLSELVLFILLIATGATLLGLAGRVSAMIILILVTVLHGKNPVDLVTAMFIFPSVWLMLLGTGRFSLWQGDDRWVNRRDGEEHS